VARQGLLRGRREPVATPPLDGTAFSFYYNESGILDHALLKVCIGNLFKNGYNKSNILYSC
jgi:hypothetical protein